MANRRMLSKFVFENDDFLDMPAESQALYAHLVINADDDGFIDHPNAIRRMTGFSVTNKEYIGNYQTISGEMPEKCRRIV